MNTEQLHQQLAALQAENTYLKNEVDQLLEAEQTLKILLEGTAATTGDDFFHSLVQQLSKALQADYIFIGELAEDEQDRVRTLAYWEKDRMAPNFEYDLWGSPCATVVGNKLQYYPQKTWELFPDDRPLAEKRIECYLGVPLFDSTDQSIGILVVMDDHVSDSIINSVSIISTFAARAAAELERKQRREALRESQDRYRHLVEQSLDAIFFIHKNRFELVNDGFCRLLEVTPEIVYAPDFDLLRIIHPSSLPEIQARMGLVYTKDMPSERFEFTAQTLNGRPIPAEVSLSYMEYKDGTAVQGILHDLSIQKTHEARQQHQRELAEALHETGMVFNSSLEIDVILDLLLEQASRIVPYDTANVILVENGRTRLVRARGYEKFGIHIDLDNQPASFDIDATPTWQKLIATKKPFIIPDIFQYKDWLHPERSPHIRSWAGAPIIIDDEVVAFLCTSKAEPNFYTAAHSTRLAAFTTQASLAWKNALLLTAVTQRADALKASGDILRILNAATEVKDIFPILAQRLQDLTGCQRVTIGQIDDKKEWATFYGLHNGRYFNSDFRLRLKDNAATADILSGKPHIVPDIAVELDKKAMHELAKAGIQSCVSLPLQDNEKPFGALTLGWEQQHGYDDGQITVLHQIADAIALGIERSRLFQTTRHRTQELKLLYQVISAAASGGAKEDILQTSCDEIASFLNVPHITLILLEDPLKIGSFEAAEAIVGAQFITPGEPDLKGQHLSFNAQNLLLTSLAHAGQPIVIEQLSNYPLSSRMSGLANMYNLVSALILPIVLRSKIIGIIGIGSKKLRTFTHHEIHLLEKVSEELGRVLETASLYEQLRNYAADLEIRVVERTQELAEANEQLKQLDKLKSRFVTDVSHELRTPVTNLKLYLDLLERKGPEKLNQYLPILQKQADRLGQLIQDILDLSRLELGRHKVEFEPLNLNTLVEEIVEAHLPRAQASDLNLSFNPDANLPQILGVRNQLAQIITNLLVNAINYTLAGDILLTTQAEPETGFACLTVADTGMGITFEDIPYLFDRFYRGEQARESNIPGTGLGLAIADEIVRIHDGRIEVSSSAGKGTTFKVWLPLFQEHAR